MREKFCLNKGRHANGMDRIVFGIFVLMASALFASQAVAIDTELFGGPLSIKGYINQSAQFGITGDHYDTWTGFQQGIMEGLLEFEYLPSNDLKVFVSGALFKDWAYNVYDSDNKWRSKRDGYSRRFNQSRDKLSLRDDYEDVLKECHVSWTPPGFNVRVGKQIVVWGRMDGVRIMDQINPMDRRLGPSDVEFESSILPIWLAKVEYYPGYVPVIFDELGIEFVFNPNADFIPNKLPSTGADVHGIWNAARFADVVGTEMRLGHLDLELREPDNWTDGREYAIRIKGTLPDATYFTLNFFRGVDDDPVYKPTGGLTLPGIVDDSGRPIMEPALAGYYPDKKFAGFTFARDFESLYINALGGVAPLLRGEFIYEFDSAFVLNNIGSPLTEEFIESDVIYWGLGVEWKFKSNALNPRRYFMLIPQFTMRHVKDYPSSDQYLQTAGGSTVSENWYMAFCTLTTQYLHDKLTPTVVFQRDVWHDAEKMSDVKGSAKADMWIFRLKYAPNHIWSFKGQILILTGDGNRYYRGMHYKDNISFTAQYQF